MANEPSTIAYDPEDRFNEAIALFEQALDDGLNPDPAAWLARYPDVADRLAGYFADQNVLKRLAAPLLPASPVSSLPRPFGAYELLEEIGRGGMGVVYRACQVPLQRSVALKMILAGQLASPDEVRRFRTEAENAARLDHPHIVPIHEVGEQDGQHYFSMKLIEGTNLGQQRERFTADPRAAARLVALVARAVHHAHQRGILHRDLKPGNILLDAQTQPHVTDFGLAKRIAESAGLTLSGAVMGTPPYMAPEQAAGQNRELTTAADVYALGAILYELLTGEPPFKAATPLETLMLVRTEEPVPPHRVRPGVERDLETVCLKCLEKDPARRYDSAEALAKELESWLGGEGISAQRASARERVIRWVRRHPAPAALILVSALAALALVGVVVGWFYAASLAEVNANLVTAQNATESANRRLAGALQQTDALRTEAERQRARAERSLYVANMVLAQSALEQGRTEQALELLERNAPTPSRPEDLRGFDWYYLLRLCRASFLPLRAHTGAVVAVWISPDGQRVASAGADRMVRIWDVATRREVRGVGPLTKMASVVAFSPDGTRIARAAEGGTIQVYDLTNGREVINRDGPPGQTKCVVFSADGKHLASGSDKGMIQILDAQTGREAASFTVPRSLFQPTAIIFSPDGCLLATCHWGGVTVWDWRARRAVLSVPLAEPQALAFSPDSKLLAAASGTPRASGGEMKVWDVATGREKFSAEEASGGFRSVQFSPDGKRLAVCGWRGFVRQWEAESGKEILRVPGNTGKAIALAFNPAARRLVAGGEDGMVRVWKVGPPPEPLALGAQRNQRYDVTFSPDGTRLASLGVEAGIQVWDARTGKELVKIPSALPNRLAFSADGQRLTNGFTVWASAGGRERIDCRSKPANGYNYGAAFSPDGRRVARGAITNVVVWDAQTGQPMLTLKGHRNLVYAVAFSPNGQWLATGGEDCLVKLWDAGTGHEMHTFPACAHPVYSLAFSPNGARLAAATGKWRDRNVPGEVKVWDMRDCREAFTLRGHTEVVWGVAFSPDGTRLASCSGANAGSWGVEAPGEIKIWDAIAGQEVLTLRKGQKGRIFAVAFSPDGKCLAATGQDGVVRIWDAESAPQPFAPPALAAKK
jgi:WD40 repeat protein